MDDTLLFIPPCCVDNKLPKAVNQAPHRQLTFYTHGDVTAEKFYKAVSHLVIDSHVMVLTMPSPKQETFMFLEQCFERGWITRLVLSTYRSCDSLIAKYLSAYADRIIYAQSDTQSKTLSESNTCSVLLLKPKKTRKRAPCATYPLSHKTKEALSASRKSLSFFTFYCTSCAVYAQRTHLKLI